MTDTVESNSPAKKRINWKLLIGLAVIISGILFLLISTTRNSLQYFLTVDELLASPASYETKDVRISGAVIGDSIQLNENDGTVQFTIANIPGDHKLIQQMGGMAKVLADAVADPDANRLNIIYRGAKPDLLKNESQAILTGKMIDNRTFEADEILLKCPTKYQGAANK